MPEDARAIANYFLDLASDERQYLTHLQLQKILFFAHAWYLAKHNEQLIGQGFEAWEFGPVVRVVFDQLKKYKNNQITEKLKKIDVSTGRLVDAAADICDEDKIFLRNLYQYYARFDPYKLVDLTHEAGGPWEKVWIKSNRGAVPGMHIPDDSIKLWILRRGGRSEIH